MMFDLYKDQEESKIKKLLRRGAISLAAGLILTFIVPAVMEAVWPYLQDSHYQPYSFAIVLASILNLPAVIYCNFFQLPESLPKSDESEYCWAVGFFFNIPYYALVIFIRWSALERLISRKRRQAEVEGQF
jgi:hypothetical protein